ncbi:hypothetical protein NW759_013285 [Fusarium solani]|nr:hypothetical protein NW759_013285 [Fusarium solani]
MSLSRSELWVLASTDVRDPIPAAALQSALASPPFIPSRSLINIRDLGAVPGSALTPGCIYRCGTLDAAAADCDAQAWLAAHVATIFDLRHATERDRGPSPEVPGVENVWLEQVGQYTSPSLEEFARGGEDGAWMREYMIVLQVYKPSIRAVLEHIRDRPTAPFLFHCTAGRDRTGVVAGLLQSLAGTAPDDILFDYMLSRIGTESAREKLGSLAMASLGVSDPETPGFWNLVSLRPSYWNAFLEGLRDEYGDWEGYVTKGLGFSATDLETVKKNLRS